MSRPSTMQEPRTGYELTADDLTWAAYVFEDKVRVQEQNKNVYLMVNSKNPTTAARLMKLFGGTQYVFGSSARWQISFGLMERMLVVLGPRLGPAGLKKVMDVRYKQSVLKAMKERMALPSEPLFEVPQDAPADAPLRETRELPAYEEGMTLDVFGTIERVTLFQCPSEDDATWYFSLAYQNDLDARTLPGGHGRIEIRPGRQPEEGVF